MVVRVASSVWPSTSVWHVWPLCLRRVNSRGSGFPGPFLSVFGVHPFQVGRDVHFVKVSFIAQPFSFLALEKGRGPRVCWSHKFMRATRSWELTVNVLRNFYMLTVLEIGHSGSLYTMEISHHNKSGLCYFAFAWEVVLQHSPGWNPRGRLQQLPILSAARFVRSCCAQFWPNFSLGPSAGLPRWC